MNRRLALPLVLAAAALSACAKAELTPSQEYYVGRSVAASAMFDAQGRFTGLYQDAALQRYVQLVGLTVALESDRPETFQGYRFAVLNSPDVNAFAMPGGFVFITTGAIKQMESEDELAGVLGHEIAHVNLRHPEDHANRATNQAGVMDALNTGSSVASSLLSGFGYAREASVVTTLAQGLGGVVDSFLQEIMVNGYGRDSELAADALSVNILCREGVRYDPRGLKAFIARLPKKDRGAWSTHPGLDGRLQAVDQEISKQSAPPAATDPVRTQRFQRHVAGLKGVQ
jgi:predicted Zn-dependent protease